jgi:Mg2+ and Co2+ transporter CorA
MTMQREAEHRFLPRPFAVERDLLSQLGERPGHQRAVHGDRELLLVVHEVPEPGVPERTARFFWKQANGVWMDAAGGPVSNTLNGLLENYTRTIDANEEALEEAESAREIFGVLRHAAPLARSTRNLTAALDSVVSYAEDDRIMRSARDRARELDRAAELLLADARMMLEFRRAEAAEEHAESAEKLSRIAFRLNLVAGFSLPLVALGGLLGMNVELPGWLRGAFWAVVLTGMALGGVVLVLVGKDTDP